MHTITEYDLPTRVVQFLLYVCVWCVHVCVASVLRCKRTQCSWLLAAASLTHSLHCLPLPLPLPQEDGDEVCLVPPTRA